MCKLGGGNLVDTCAEIRKTLEMLNRNQNACMRISNISKISSYPIVAFGKNADFVEVVEGMVWWARRMRGVMDVSTSLGDFTFFVSHI